MGRIARAEALKKLMNVLSELLEVGILCFTDAGVCLRSLDRARVSLVTVVLWPASFEAFDLDGDLDVCVRFEAFADALRFAEDAAVVTLRVRSWKHPARARHERGACTAASCASRRTRFLQKPQSSAWLLWGGASRGRRPESPPVRCGHRLRAWGTRWCSRSTTATRSCAAS